VDRAARRVAAEEKKKKDAEKARAHERTRSAGEGGAPEGAVAGDA
jgi:hypothetical protein